MKSRRDILFLQLPQIDNDAMQAAENLHLAASYLRYAAERAGELRYCTATIAGPEMESLDDHHLAAALVRRAPAILAATLYLWNVERTLRVLSLVKNLRPQTRVVVGGPEVAPHHPFLFRTSAVDVAVVGEGEIVFPHILRALRTGRPTDFTTVFWRGPQGWRTGRRPPPPVSLADHLPPAGHRTWRPDRHGMAYLEISRGCPMDCTYCRYPHLRQAMSYLPADEVRHRVAVLQRRNAREIRFVDPTFNAHPQWRRILEGLAQMNADGRVRFFAEIKADWLQPSEADLLAHAHFAEVEVGLQSRDPRVLRAIRRPTNLPRLENGLRMLSQRGIRVTLDIMYGLPHQSCAEVLASLRWALRRPRVNVQCLQTLLLPGTVLRAQRRRWGMAAEAKPPYGVTQTAALSHRSAGRVETFLERTPRLRSDCPTQRFVGPDLPDLFREREIVNLTGPAPVPALPGSRLRRALIFAGAGLFAQRKRILRMIRTALRQEPHMLWQFVLAPGTEEPLDLADMMIQCIRRFPPHLIDRYGGARAAGKCASRRVFILLKRGRRYDPVWRRAAEDLLRQHFV